ncbi:MAG: alanine--tRNA ligase [Candidatus Andersenbacteria bacterium]|nr:alanine--tRNA ligase [Candidatus Andersenbacteria bacterium]
MGSNELREMYQRFFESKGHVRIPSAPLVPENDPSVLFTTAGMHPLVPYLKGQPHPAGKRLTNAQKCLRTTDIDAVGDASHATVFEMLGNWSLGDYFKREAIGWSWEFLTSAEWLDIAPEYLAVSVFAGTADPTSPRNAPSDDGATGLRGGRLPRDEESACLWRDIGVPKERIAYLGIGENWWPAGGEAVGPQGPDTEMFYWVGKEIPPRHFDPSDQRWVEIWNDVFMQYDRQSDGTLARLAQQNVDTGMGLERTVMALNGLSSVYEIDTYQELMHLLRRAAQRPDERHVRIMADHLKAAAWLLADEHPVRPAKTDQGYVLRRLIRRAVRSARVVSVADARSVFAAGFDAVAASFAGAYPSLAVHGRTARDWLRQEIDRFEATLSRGLKVMARLVAEVPEGGTMRGGDAFRLYETHGFPLELIQEIAAEHKRSVDVTGFAQSLASHQERSRSSTQGKFDGGLSDHSRQSIKYHTATHLLHQALRDVLGDHVLQCGSNITPERLRFDFSHPDKLSHEQMAAVERTVNERIAEDLPVRRQEMTVADAKQRGAVGLFTEKYGELVSVYSIGSYSQEICGGPHVSRTGEIGHFKITREESAGAGVRRLRAVLE